MPSRNGTEAAAVNERMYLVRVLEDRLQALCLDGLAGDLHFSKGQEAIPVGVCSMLRPSDYVVTHHRTIAHAIAKGVPLKPLVAEILGKATGINGGAAGEMHMSYPATRFMFSFQLVGTCVPVAAGLAWAVQYHLRTDDIVVVFHGDAATANGQWHEGVNLAAVNKCPLLLVCENNHLAGNVGPEHYQPVPHVADRAAGYGVSASTVDGNDIAAVQAAAAHAIAHVRERREPYLLECETTRLGRHKQGMGDLRTKEDIERLALRDPLRRVSLAPERRRELEAEIDQALEAALKAPPPEMPTRLDSPLRQKGD